MLLLAHIENKKKDFNNNDVERVEKIRSGDKIAFEKLFFEYHSPLIRFAITITKSRELARDCVQDVFLKIWRNRKDWNIQYSVKAYLFQSVRNQSLNLLGKQNSRNRLKKNFETEADHYTIDTDVTNNAEYLTDKERRQLTRIWEIVEEMPERRRLAFHLNRRHGLSYKEISSVLNISRKTVENHIGQAVEFIRSKISREVF